jgi:UDP-2,3-diacylglucosamine pyrophosphatase LpxH
MWANPLSSSSAARRRTCRGFTKPTCNQLNRLTCMSDDDIPIRRVRTAFVSDVHLGTRGCQAELLLDFIKHVEFDNLYLIGDIVDGWRLKSGWYWPQAHNDVVQKILRLARKGVKVVYIPGNHDEFAREYCGTVFGDVHVVHDAIHVTADGRKLLIVHGDEFDGVVQYAKWLALLGDWAYGAVLALNTWFNLARRRMGFGYWSLSAYLKNKVKNAVKFVDAFEVAVADEARRRGADGVVCGHIHKAAIRDVGGIQYLNDGDWVESCTALVENRDGSLEIIEWAKLRSWSMLERAAPALDLVPAGEKAAA